MSRPMTDTAKDIGRSRGFTLIELMVTVAILGIVALALTKVLLASNRTEARTMRRSEVQSSARQTLSVMATELRQAGADPASPPLGLTGVVEADVDVIHVRADLNADRSIQTAEPSEDVTYRYNSGARTVTRDPGTGAATIMSNVTAMQLSYFDSANQPITPLPLSSANASRVTSIGLTMTTEKRDSRPLTLTTRINLRNR